LQNNQSQRSSSLSCAACKKQASGLIYACDICKYCLHKTCSTLPQTFKHKVDVKHPLTLLSTPIYREGVFRCNACGSNGAGFCYHCGDCQIDIHPICAIMPFEIDSPAHNHPLQICFDPPYDDGGFNCDICDKSGSNHWLYRCETCQFDAHMKCAKNPPPVQSIRTNIVRSDPHLVTSRSVHGQPYYPPAPPHLVTSRSVRGQPNQPPPAATYVPTYVPPPATFMPPPPCTCGGRQNGGGHGHHGQGNLNGGGSGYGYGYGHGQPERNKSGLAGRVVEGLVEGLAQQAGQALFLALADS